MHAEHRSGWSSFVRVSHRCLLGAVGAIVLLALSGCFAQQADLIKQEKELAKARADLDRLIGETRAKLNQDIANLREEEIPAIRGSVDKSTNRFDALQRRIDDLDAKTNARLNVLEKIQHDYGNLIKSERDKSQDELAKLAAAVAALTKQVEAKLDVINRSIKENEAQDRAMADHLAQNSKATSDHLAGVNKSIASLTKAVTAVSDTLSARQAEQDRRIDALSKSMRTPGNAAAKVSKEGKTGTKVAPTPVPAPAVDGAAAVDDEQKAYDHSLEKWKAGEYEQALQGFTDFLQRYPDSKLAANAHFWLGESYYGNKDYARAIEAFDRVNELYPASPKVPAALLKKGYAYIAIDDRGRASSTLKQLLESFPKSPEAVKAKEKLAQLQ